MLRPVKKTYIFRRDYNLRKLALHVGFRVDQTLGFFFVSRDFILCGFGFLFIHLDMSRFNDESNLLLLLDEAHFPVLVSFF